MSRSSSFCCRASASRSGWWRDRMASGAGRTLPEPSVRFPERRRAPAVVVPPHAYYVLGDNRAESDDSRNWGVLHDDAIVGKALVGIWPPRRI